LEVTSMIYQLLDLCDHLSSFAPPVVHGHISPASVFLGKDMSLSADDSGLRVSMLDFGEEGVPFASAHGDVQEDADALEPVDKNKNDRECDFLAPELVGGGQATPLSDLYGVGTVLLYSLCGREPTQLPRKRRGLQINVKKSLIGTPWLQERWLVRLLQALLAAKPQARPACAKAALLMLPRRHRKQRRENKVPRESQTGRGWPWTWRARRAANKMTSAVQADGHYRGSENASSSVGLTRGPQRRRTWWLSPRRSRMNMHGRDDVLDVIVPSSRCSKLAEAFRSMLWFSLGTCCLWSFLQLGMPVPLLLLGLLLPWFRAFLHDSSRMPPWSGGRVANHWPPLGAYVQAAQRS